MATGGGNDSRTSILPTQNTAAIGTTPPNYSFADELPMPDQIGVRKGGSLNDVANAVRGIAFYSDMIGFGAPSTGLTRGMPIDPFPMGVNHFLRTMTKCSNGADMWAYVNGIPKGDALGKKVAEALDRLDMPGLRGMAPGILEDVKDGLNPVPIMNAVFGTGYAKCKQVTLPVGTSRGSLKNVDGQDLVQPLFPGDIKIYGRTPHQTRFVFDKWLTKEEWDKENQSATQCPDGTRIIDHDQNDCKKGLLRMEGFTSSQVSEGLLPTALLLALAAVLWTRYRNK
jgi:hypothetical protein